MENWLRPKKHLTLSDYYILLSLIYDIPGLPNQAPSISFLVTVCAGNISWLLEKTNDQLQMPNMFFPGKISHAIL